MDELAYEQTVEMSGRLRDRLQRLEDVDYMTAFYKGYSTSGATLAEIKAEQVQLTEQIAELEEQLADYEW